MQAGKRKRLAILSSVALVLLLAVISPFLFGKDTGGPLPTISDLVESIKDKDNTTQAPQIPNELKITYIDVRQGDSSLIQCGDKLMLIDAGEGGNEEKILNLIKDTGINKIDILVATHPHSDHIGSLPAILESIEVSTIIMPYISEQSQPTTKLYEKFLDAVAASGAKVERAQPGKQYSLNDLEITILGPHKDTGELNNLSVVLRADFKDTSFLFTADAEKKAEQDILNNDLNIKADVIKIGHHGSNSSTSEAYLKKVSPKYAIISCGTGNRYGHPAKVTLDLLNKYNIKYYRTDYNGNITVKSDGKNIDISSER